MSETPDTPPPAPDVEPVDTVVPTKDEKNMAMLAHLLGIFTWFIGALIIWLIKKDDSEYVADHGCEALNFQITMSIGWLIASATTVIVIGCFLAPALWLVNIIFCILAAVAASKGERYRYPFAIRLVK